MNALPEMLGFDSTDLTAPPDAALNLVATTARRQLALEDEIAEQEERLKKLKSDLQIVSEIDLPQAMHAAGCADFTLRDGGKVKIELKYRCGQLDDAPDDPKRRPLSERLEALAWLEDNGHGDLARNVITVTIGRDQDELIEGIMQYLSAQRSNSMEVKRARTVVWNTLSSFVKEQDRAMEEPPFELLGVSKVNVAKITRPKAGE